jgi:hypothetical protein
MKNDLRTHGVQARMILDSRRPDRFNPFDVAFGFWPEPNHNLKTSAGHALAFIYTASLLSAFNLPKSVEKDGNVIDFSGKFEPIVVL